MNLRFLRSLRNQTLLILILVLGVSHLISISIYSIDRRNSLAADDALDVAERAAGIANVLIEVPPHLREPVIRGADSAAFRVSMAERPAAITDGNGDDLDPVRGYLRAALSGLGPDDVLAGTLQPEEAPDLRRSGVERLLQISLKLPAGGWLNVTGIIAVSETLWPRPAVLYILSDLLAMVAVGIWMVYRVTSPLTIFARAAERLGKDLRSKPLAETGPEEVTLAARAFNEMQHRLQRMIETRTEMLAAISHDLRTPITVLTLRAEQLDHGSDRDKLLAILDEMQTMVSSVLALARETFEDEPSRTVDLSAMLQSLSEDLQDTGAAVTLTAPDQVLYRCRRVALKRAITNLVDNAIRYGGGAELSLEDREAEVVVEVRDRGPGFATAELQELFVPFFRAERSRSRDTGGTGLGLSIAKAIVESHGGTLAIDNLPESGALAVIRLPK